MSKNFESLKKKSLISAILKSLAVGGSALLAAAGILLLAFTLSDAAESLGVGALVGIGCAVSIVCALSAGGLAFLFLRPTDMKVAKRYDKEFALGERLQTMVEFAGQEGEMISMQRQNALEVISTLPNPKVKFSRIWKYVASLALAVCVSGTGIGFTVADALQDGSDVPPIIDTPSEVDPGNPDSDLFKYDLFMESGLVGLIEDVRASTLADKVKTAVIDRLEALRAELAEIDSKEKMRETVSAAVEDVDAIINEVNSFRGIAERVQPLDENMYSALVDSILIYKTSSLPLNTADRVKSFKAGITSNIEMLLEYHLPKSLEALKVKQVPDNPEDPDLETVLAAYIVGLTGALTVQAEGEAQTGDLLVEAFETFIRALGNVPVGKGYRDNALWGVDDSGNALSNPPTKNNIKNAYDNLAVNLNTALGEQCYNCVMETFIRLRLCDIFGLSSSALPEFNNGLTSSGKGPGTDPDDKDGPGHGGNGPGTENYAGNDKIYDIDSVGSDPDAAPDIDGYVYYGDVLDKYYAVVYGRLENLEISDDMMKIITNYFKNLYYDKENNEQDDN